MPLSSGDVDLAARQRLQRRACRRPAARLLAQPARPAPPTAPAAATRATSDQACWHRRASGPWRRGRRAARPRSAPASCRRRGAPSGAAVRPRPAPAPGPAARASAPPRAGSAPRTLASSSAMRAANCSKRAGSSRCACASAASRARASSSSASIVAQRLLRLPQPIGMLLRELPGQRAGHATHTLAAARDLRVVARALDVARMSASGASRSRCAASANAACVGLGLRLVDLGGNVVAALGHRFDADAAPASPARAPCGSRSA